MWDADEEGKSWVRCWAVMFNYEDECTILSSREERSRIDMFKIMIDL